MANETTIPDSDAEQAIPQESEVDAAQTASPDAEESEEGNQTEREDSKGSDKVGKRLDDTEAALKEKQRELHALTTQIAEMRGKMDGLMVAVQRDQREEQEIPDPLDDTSMDAEGMENPVKFTKEKMKQVRAQLATLLQERDKYWEQRLASLIPKNTEYAAELDELQKNPVIASQPIEVQVAMAKTLRAAKSAANVAVKPAPGPVAGSNGRTAKAKPKTPEEDPLVKQYLAMVGLSENKTSKAALL